MSALATADRLCVLRIAASFLWADLEVAPQEHDFLLSLARELGAAPPELAEVQLMLATPPDPEDIDPTKVAPALAHTVRDAALRAIAADGRVAPREMELFDLLDELLPDDDPPRPPRTAPEPRPVHQPS